MERRRLGRRTESRVPRTPLIALSVVAAVAAVGLGAARGGSTATVAAARAPGPLLAVLPGRVPLQLARLDPKTLRPRPAPRVDVGYPGCAPRQGGEACWSI